MDNSIFNPNEPENLSSKIVTGLERISEVFKILLWEKAKVVGLSPIQIQILIFIAYHKKELCSVSHLAKEFNLTKPTVSDAVKSLDMKGMIVKDFTSSDQRSYTIQMSAQGKNIITQINDFANPLKTQVDKFEKKDLEGIFKTMTELIFQLNRAGVLTVQRTCYGCKFYQKNASGDFCNFLNKELHTQDIRLDCPEHVEKVS